MLIGPEAKEKAMPEFNKRLVDGEWDIHPSALPGTLLAKAPRPHYPPTIIDAERYYSRGRMEQEWEHLWTKVWTVAGLVSDLKDVGDFFTYELGPESIIVTRASTTEIKAFYNVCAHRGNKLVYTDSGRLERFSCAFHGWQYSLSGDLLHITDEELFPKELICDRPGLSEIKVDNWGGLVFVNLDPNAEPLMEFLGIIPEHMSGYNFENYYIFSDTQMEWNANWKTAVDAFVELYHSHVVHPQGKMVWEDKFIQYDCYPKGHSRMLVPWGVTSHRDPEPTTLNAQLADQLTQIDIDPASYDGPVHDIRAALLEGKRKFGKLYGMSNYDMLTDDQLMESWSYSVFPNWTINVQDTVLMLQFWRPHKSDPEKLIYNIMMFFPRTNNPSKAMVDIAEMGNKDTITVASPDDRPARKCTTDGADLGHVLNQDYQQVPLQQIGLRSRGFKGMRFGGEEIRLRHFHAFVDDYIAVGEKRLKAENKSDA